MAKSVKDIYTYRYTAPRRLDKNRTQMGHVEVFNHKGESIGREHMGTVVRGKYGEQQKADMAGHIIRNHEYGKKR
jgi:hypothetical protein